jgi:hypothetical protein
VCWLAPVAFRSLGLSRWGRYAADEAAVPGPAGWGGAARVPLRVQATVFDRTHARVEREHAAALVVGDLVLGRGAGGLDVGDAAGNSADQWIVSNEIVHPPIVDQADFDAHGSRWAPAGGASGPAATGAATGWPASRGVEVAATAGNIRTSDVC